MDESFSYDADIFEYCAADTMVVVDEPVHVFGMLEKLDKLTGEDSSVTFTVSADPSELPTSVTRFID